MHRPHTISTFSTICTQCPSTRKGSEGTIMIFTKMNHERIMKSKHDVGAAIFAWSKDIIFILLAFLVNVARNDLLFWSHMFASFDGAHGAIISPLLWNTCSSLNLGIFIDYCTHLDICCAEQSKARISESLSAF